jgi:hypothetical protein
MRRSQLDELLGRLASLVDRDEVTMIGSQCVHAVTNDPPAEILLSQECDILFDSNDPAFERINEELGVRSKFQRETGVYLDPITGTFPFLPEGWEQRAAAIIIGTLTVRCLEIHDLVLSKLVAGRLKDNEMVAALLAHRLAELDTIRARISTVHDLRLRAILMARLQLVLENV